MSPVSSVRRRLLRLAVVVPVLLASSACLNDEVTPRPEPTFTRLILRFEPNGGGIPQNIEITRANGAVSGPLTIPATGGTLRATYLNVDGSEDLVLQRYQQEYETRVALTTGTGTGAAAFARTGANAFTVTPSAAGAATARVQLWDLGLTREVLGTTVAVTVQ